MPRQSFTGHQGALSARSSSPRRALPSQSPILAPPDAARQSQRSALAGQHDPYALCLGVIDQGAIGRPSSYRRGTHPGVSDPGLTAPRSRLRGLRGWGLRAVAWRFCTSGRRCNPETSLWPVWVQPKPSGGSDDCPTIRRASSARSPGRGGLGVRLLGARRGCGQRRQCAGGNAGADQGGPDQAGRITTGTSKVPQRAAVAAARASTLRPSGSGLAVLHPLVPLRAFVRRTAT